MIERFWNWSRQMREAYRELSAEPDYRYMYDPYWVRAEPYRVVARPGAAGERSPEEVRQCREGERGTQQGEGGDGHQEEP